MSDIYCVQWKALARGCYLVMLRFYPNHYEKYPMNRNVVSSCYRYLAVDQSWLDGREKRAFIVFSFNLESL